MQGFSAGRRAKPKVVKSTIEDEDEDIRDAMSVAELPEIESQENPTIKRLNRSKLTTKSSGSKLKLSFGADDEAESDGTFVPKRSALSRQISESRGRNNAMPNTLSDATTLSSRPTYTKEYLNQLRDSTPSTPKDLSRYLSDDSPDNANSPAPVSKPRPAEILDEAVIRALRERRRERARGEDYVSLDADDARPRRAESDDEDAYANYVDEPVRLQRNMEAAQQKYKKEQIQEALYHSDSEAMSEMEDDEWENQQIAKAHPNLIKSRKLDIFAAPSEIPPVPTFAAALGRLKDRLEAMKTRRAELLESVRQLEKEAEEIKQREESVQESLARAGKEYEMLREEFKATRANRGLDEVGELGSSTIQQ